MDLLRYAVSLGIIHLFLTFVWNFAVAMPLLSILPNRWLYKTVYVIKAIMVLILLSTFACFASIKTQETDLMMSFVYYSIGGFTLYLILTKQAGESARDLAENPLFEIQDDLRIEGLITIGAIGLYILMAFFPVLSVNIITINAIALIVYLTGINILGELLLFGGALVLLNLSYFGIITLFSWVSAIRSPRNAP